MGLVCAIAGVTPADSAEAPWEATSPDDAAFAGLSGAFDACRTMLAARTAADPSTIRFVSAWRVDTGDPTQNAFRVLVDSGGSTHAYQVAPGQTPVYLEPYREPSLVDYQELTAANSPWDGLDVRVDGTLVAVGDELVLVDAQLPPGTTAPLPGTVVLVGGPIAAPLTRYVATLGQAWGTISGRFESGLTKPEGYRYGRTGVLPCQIQAFRFQPSTAPGLVPGLLRFSDLAERADECHRHVVTVRASYVTHFEYQGLKPDADDQPTDATCWLAGDLSGFSVPVAAFQPVPHPVEVVGVFERRRDFDGSNGYGHLGADRFRLNVIAGYRLGTELDYARVLGTEPAGRTIAVRGRLARRGAEAYLVRADGAEQPTCLVAGGLWGLEGAPDTGPAPLPVLVLGTMAQVPSRDGAAPSGHPYTMAARFVRPLWEELARGQGDR